MNEDDSWSSAAEKSPTWNCKPEDHTHMSMWGIEKAPKHEQPPDRLKAYALFWGGLKHEKDLELEVRSRKLGLRSLKPHNPGAEIIFWLCSFSALPADHGMQTFHEYPSAASEPP